ncbi:MAG: phenylalanine--tRNA ligase subunit beta [Bacilli bacterium]|jgi:phenylalanyl-tRNA synthetase beta chain|nr:phenylalanine--tRNA ligase subunit beta [Bacilli bacterium]MDD3388806.1 phenylalanine--tRNA ligase subunit beta [Bacilli bacterium]MDD4344596.1 phenylalanine--tRNA ligase subunit beta [Bacilli bacterium]MDD4520490.1 phenylalanine--tRNA ligase subunit beta [Bacilli bacterium]MDY0399095.1 phenylalanine--tRNA ligase subunit beta [Bacilli bacterium]
MKVSYNLLKKYVDLSGISPFEVAHKLTFAGLEVESVSALATGDLLVIGEIVKCEKHPDSDHLSVLEVNLGAKYGLKQIICGAPNVRVGLKVIVARVGATLADNLKISASKIRGVTSEGMCCALNEIGVEAKYLRAEQVDGIEELPADAPVGAENVLEYLLLDDYTLEIKILANRPDAQAIFNLAREISGLFNRPLIIPEYHRFKEVEENIHVSSSTPSCRQFAIRIVRDLTMGSSPLWLQRYLMASGIRSINRLVDIGNYVMLLTGQPLHMYDLDKISGANFIVRDDLEVEKWQALDQKYYHVLPGDIAITVDGEIMCLGGVMGALASAIDDQTRNVAIEAAHFHPATIRRTSTRLNLVSDSSQRFAKGINPHQTAAVLELATQLVRELCAGQQVSQIANYDELNYQPLVVTTSVHEINDRLGTDFDLDEITDALKRLAMGVDVNHDQIRVKIPSARIDISGAADIAEEVIRILGFERVKNVLPRLDATLGVRSQYQQKIYDVRSFLRLQGLDEILTYTLVNTTQQKLFMNFNAGNPYELLHPMTPEHALVRTTLLPSMLDTLRYNYTRQNSNLAMFEVSEVYRFGKQETHLSIGLVGQVLMQANLTTHQVSYYDVKGYLEGLLDLLGISASRYQIKQLDEKLFREFHPGRQAGLYSNNSLLAIIGELHPDLRKNLDFVKAPVALLEVNLSGLLALKVSQAKIKQIDRFPVVTRDLAIVVSNEFSASDILTTISRAGKNALKNVDIFDVYSGNGVENGMKSLALRLTLGSSEQTLTELEIQKVLVAVIEALKKNFQARIRE